LPLADALLGYTNFYIRFGLGRDFDRTHPGWQDYLAGLRVADDGQDWTYRFYMTRPHALGSPPVVATFGCFSYSRLRDDRIRLHFENAQTDGGSSLGSSRRSQRLACCTTDFSTCPCGANSWTRHGEIKKDMARRLLDRLGSQSSLAGLDQCFPLQVLTVEALVQEFYAFYGV